MSSLETDRLKGAPFAFSVTLFSPSFSLRALILFLRCLRRVIFSFRLGMSNLTRAWPRSEAHTGYATWATFCYLSPLNIIKVIPCWRQSGVMLSMDIYLFSYLRRLCVAVKTVTGKIRWRHRGIVTCLQGRSKQFHLLFLEQERLDARRWRANVQFYAEWNCE